MIDALNLTPNLALAQSKIPSIRGSQDAAEIEKTARDFSSVFFSEYVGIMLDEVEEAEEDFSNDIYRTLHSQMIGEKLVDSDPGRKITEMLMAEINKMQAKIQEKA